MLLHALVSGVIGVITGVLGVAPIAIVARRARKPLPHSVAMGLSAVFASFCFMTVAIGVGYLLDGQTFVVYASASIGGFLVAVGIVAARAWVWMNGSCGK
jgi:protein-S-isoprenylcysteine O-methyltransferase Ste14